MFHQFSVFRLPKMNTPEIPKVTNHDLQNEVQDFSLKKQGSSTKGIGNKLDDTLSKLMKRKNCVSNLNYTLLIT